ncbi:MAG: hypothetical protein R3B57_06750 [Phycisphaerales bacterium]
MTRPKPSTPPAEPKARPAPRAATPVPPTIVPDASSRPSVWRDLLPTAISLLIHASLLATIFYISATTPSDAARRLPLAEVDINPAVETPRPLTPPLESPPIQASPSNPSPNATTVPRAVSPQVRPTELVGLTTELDPQAPDLLSAIGSSAGLGSAGAIAAADPGAQTFASFAGLRSKAASRIVYVVDASGAMASSFSFVQDKLKRSIDRLGPTQHFQVVLFGDRRDRPEGSPPYQFFTPRGIDPELVRATPTTQKLAAKWIDSVIPGGRSNPADGLRAAFALKPDLIFLLSRSIQRSGPNASWGRGKDAILAELEELNPASKHTGQRKVVIKTIQFLDEDPTGIMKAIASLHGDGEGSYRLLAWEDLRDEPDEAQRMALADALSEDDSVRLERAAQRLASVEEDGAALSVLFGVPLEEQAESVRQASEFTLRLLASIDSKGADDPRSPTDARVPLLRARAAILLASLTDEPSYRKSLAETAIANVEHLSVADSDADAARRVAHAVALVEAGDALEARRVLLALIREAPALRASPTIIGEARLAMLLTARNPAERAAATDALHQSLDQAPFTIDRLPDPLWRLAAAEAVARTRLPEPSLAPSALDDLLALAADPELMRDPTRRRALIYAKVARATDPYANQITWEQMPPEAAFARAVILAHTVAGGVEALDLFDLVSRREDAGELRAEALWESAIILRIQNTDESRATATVMLEEIASDYPDSPRAADARAAVVAEVSSDASLLPEAFKLDSLRLAVEHAGSSPQADLYRVKYAERIEGRGRLDVLEPVTPDTPEGTAAAALYLQTVRELLTATPPPSERDRVDLLRRAVKMADRHDFRPRAQLLVELGEAELDSGDPGRAMPLLVRAAARNEPVEGGAERIDIDRARAHLAVNQSPEAFTLLRDVAGRLDAGAQRDARFWHAWTLMLEILADRAEAGEGAGVQDARAHLGRLRLIDTKLGGEPWRSRLNAVRQRLDSLP